MNAFLTIMAVIGILVTLFVLTVVFVLVRLVLKVRRGLAQAGPVHIVHPQRRHGGGADTEFAQAGSITLATGAWTSTEAAASDTGDTCQTGGDDGGSSGGDCGSSDGGSSSSSD